jgi:hypothetical protein
MSDLATADQQLSPREGLRSALEKQLEHCPVRAEPVEPFDLLRVVGKIACAPSRSVRVELVETIRCNLTAREDGIASLRMGPRQREVDAAISLR